MLISVVNHTNGKKKVSDEEVQRVIRAVNRQVTEDFEPYWGMGAMLRLEGRASTNADEEKPIDLRGDAILYLLTSVADADGTLGFHDKNAAGIPFGFVYTEISEQLGEPWSATFSHEALELIADPEANLLVMGPHPSEDRIVFHWYEMSDAVQTELYEIDGVKVSNFVLPLYFTGSKEADEPGSRNNFLGTPLDSFGIAPGGYVGFYDPESQRHQQVFGAGAKKAEARSKIKARAALTRRSTRYSTCATRFAARRRPAVVASPAGPRISVRDGAAAAPPASLAAPSVPLARNERRRKAGAS
jgi:hypothetical protein